MIQRSNFPYAQICQFLNLVSMQNLKVLFVRVRHHFTLLLARFSKNALIPQLLLRHGTLLAMLNDSMLILR